MYDTQLQCCNVTHSGLEKKSAISGKKNVRIPKMHVLKKAQCYFKAAKTQDYARQNKPSSLEDCMQEPGSNL